MSGSRQLQTVVHSSFPLVSVISPALNAARWLEEMIDSVKRQDYPAIEMIFLSTGSTDDTEVIIRQCAPDATLVTDGPPALGAKLNRGFRMATGDILNWLNPDDLFLPGAVSAAVTALNADPAVGFVCADMIEIDEAGNEIRRVDSPEFDLAVLLNEGNIVSQPTAFARRALVEEVGGFDESYQYCMDYELWIRLAKKAPVRHHNGYWAYYRRHPTQLSAVQGASFGRELVRASRSHGGRFFSPLACQHRRMLRMAGHLRRGDWRTIRRAVKFKSHGALIHNMARILHAIFPTSR